MTGADNFVQNCKDIINERIYAEFRSPEVFITNPLPPKDIALIENETGVRPENEIKIYKPTGSKLHGYYEYIYYKTITR